MESPIRTSMETFIFPHPPTHSGNNFLLNHIRQHSSFSTTPFSPPTSHSRGSSQLSSDFPSNSTLPSTRTSIHVPDLYPHLKGHLSIQPKAAAESPVDPFFRLSYASKSDTPIPSPATLKPLQLGQDNRHTSIPRSTSETIKLPRESVNIANNIVSVEEDHDIDDGHLNFLDDYQDSRSSRRLTSRSSLTAVMPSASLSTINNIQQTISNEFDESRNSISSLKSKSPPKGLGAFFGWGNPPNTSEMQQDISSRRQSLKSFTKNIAIDVPKANVGAMEATLRADSGISLSPYTPQPIFQAIEEELRYVSADLAASIRREMELEDIVERLQSVIDTAGGRNSPINKRTSDYFSDAGSAGYAYDQEPSKTEVDYDKLVRKGEQEKTRLRLDLSSKLHEERTKVQQERARRKELEFHVQKLEEQVTLLGSSTNNDERVRELELGLDEIRRKYNEERKMKENLEDLLTAIREESETHRNEADHLRDEIIPQLKLQIDGLESESVEANKFTYDQARMQQEIEKLRQQNANLMETHRQILQMRTQQERIVTQNSTYAVSSSSVPASPNPVLRDKESLIDKMKDVEAQRDALQQALRNLRLRNTVEAFRAQSKIKTLEAQRNSPDQNSSKRKKKFEEVSLLKREITQLRKRADDALDAKQVCERGLTSLKMDMQKAEKETKVLRDMLHDHDALIAERDDLRHSNYQLDMLTADNEMNASSLQEAMVALKEAADLAKAERDDAREEAEYLRRQTLDLQESEREHLNEEVTLTNQLRMSAVRVEELATQVSEQLKSNSSLRGRLAKAVERGEQNQQAAAQKITTLQSKLQFLEDKVIVAQRRLENATVEHEQEIRMLKDSHTSQLHRIKTFIVPTTSARTSTLFSPSSLRSSRLPKFEWLPHANRNSMSDLKTAMLEERVKQLERALENADQEMEDVISRLNHSQIETAELRNERDDALQQTRRLHAQIEAQHSRYVKLLH